MTQAAPEYEYEYGEPPTPEVQKPSRAYRAAPATPPRGTTVASPVTTARPRGNKPEPSNEEKLIDRAPPTDLAAEAGVLGSIIIDPEVAGGVFSIIKTENCFFKEQNQIVFRVMLDLWNKNTPIDGMILHSTLKDKHLIDQVGGVEYIKELANAVPTSANAFYYAAMVKEKHMRRLAISAFTAGLRDCYESDDPADSLIDRCDAAVQKLTAERVQTGSGAEIGTFLYDAMEVMDGNHQGVKTGYIELDDLQCGMNKGDMIILGARPSTGKTALALNIIEHVSIQLRQPTLVFSMEMSKLQLGQRMLSSRSGVDSHLMRRGMLTFEHRARLSGAVAEISDAPIYIDDRPGLTLTDLRVVCRQRMRKEPPAVIVIDYLQLMTSPIKGETQVIRIGALSSGIKALARELNVPIICLSQLNRASAKDLRPPRVDDLRDSGNIEQDADVIWLLHREAVLHQGDTEWFNNNPDKIHKAELIVAKQRNWPVGVVQLTYLNAQTRFVNYNPGV